MAATLCATVALPTPSPEESPGDNGVRQPAVDGPHRLKSVIEISADRLIGNARAVRDAVGPEVELLGVIKAEAYGHGADLCARVLAGAGVRWLGVGDVEEGRFVREALRGGMTANPGTTGNPGLQSPHLVVMCGFEPAEATEIVSAQLTPVVWTLQHIEALEEATSRLPIGVEKNVAIHLEIDSGMARQGIAPGVALGDWLQRLKRSPSLRCEGVFSHLSSSEISGSEQTTTQCDRFATALAQVREAGVRPRFVHLGNSSAVDEGSTLAWLRQGAASLGARPMVRPGLALYGYSLALRHSAETAGASRADLAGKLAGRVRPVARWTTRITGLREIVAGESVGYGATFTAERPMRLALLPVGYADGLRREASSGVGNGWVVIAGVRAPVVGRVSMNLTVVDVSEHSARGIAVDLGAEAVLLGEGVSAEDHARWAGTIPYEILCGLRGHRRLQPTPDGKLG